MPRPAKQKRDLDETLTSARTLLSKLDDVPADSAETLILRMQTLVDLLRDLQDLSLHHTERLLSRSSGSERILQYLQLRLGEVVSREELFVVSAILEYARRIREWEDEFGWEIKSSKQGYTLKKAQPDDAKAERWQTMNRIRRSQGPAMAKMLELLQCYVGQVVTTAQLRYVAEGKDLRRVRELRTERGWLVMTRNTGMPELKMGQYVLIDSEPMEEHDRVITDRTIVRILTRDGNRCQKRVCGWHPSDRVAGDPRQYVELHHVTWHVDGGANDDQNLVTLCNMHHKEVHKHKVGPEAFFLWLQDSEGQESKPTAASLQR